VKRPGGLEEIVQPPASDGNVKVPLGPVILTHVPAIAWVTGSAGDPGAEATVKPPREKGVPGVVASFTTSVLLCPGVAVNDTVKPPVNTPEASIAQAGLTSSGSVSEPPEMEIVHGRTLPVETNPPPVMLTVPHPGAAAAGDITTTGVAVSVNTDALEMDPPE
jgi:hypothetical protein